MPGVSTKITWAGVGDPHAEDPVPRGLRLVGDDRDLRPDEPVQQRGLPGVGPADQGDEAGLHWSMGFSAPGSGLRASGRVSAPGELYTGRRDTAWSHEPGAWSLTLTRAPGSRRRWARLPVSAPAPCSPGGARLRALRCAGRLIRRRRPPMGRGQRG